MNCLETQKVIHAYFDRELDLMRSLAVEQHLKDCPNCARLHRQWQSLRTALADKSFYFDAPGNLQNRIHSALPQANTVPLKTERKHLSRIWRWPTLLAPLAAAALILLIGVPTFTNASAERRLMDEIVSAHVRSLMVDHKTDVASSDQHTVKPWFDGKIDFAPQVIDLSTHGFPLIGGRLDYLQGRPVAALVYQRQKHFINLFIWPAASNSNTSIKVATLRGYNQVHWQSSGMTYWAVSDLNSTDLADFARLIEPKPL